MSELERLRALVAAGLASLEASRQRIDDLNVYPVPDGDTGTNLTLTLRAVADALAASAPADRERLAHETARAALMGARGNSGVILSQIVRGACESLGTGGTIDGDAVGAAFAAASDAAYRAVRRPVEGTMLTAIREMAEAARAAAAAGAGPAAVLAESVRAGEDAVARTPELLEVLRRAGVVDAGAAGLVEIVRGIAASVAGEPLPEPPAAVEALPLDAVHLEESRFRYCTVFVVEGSALDRDELADALEPLGDSLLVVGDGSALKVHVHTDEPGAALALGTARGVLEGVEIANMHAQAGARSERLQARLPQEEHARCAVVAVGAGAGLRDLLLDLGAATVVEGGQTMNPSTADLVAALDALAADEAVLLPNNGNVVLAAEQAAPLARLPVRVVPTRTVQAGLAALVAFDPDEGAEANAAAMAEAAAAVVVGEVTRASRDAEIDGVAVANGAWLGLVAERAVAAGESFDEVARAVVAAVLAEPRSLLTLLTGADEPDLAALLAWIGEREPGLEVEVAVGGQPHYPLLVSAE